MRNLVWSLPGNLKKFKSNRILRSFLILPVYFFTCFISLTILITGCKKKEVPAEEITPIVWKTLLPSIIYYGSPALSSYEKTVYIGTSTGLFGNHQPGQAFVAIDAATGSVKWKLELECSEVRSTPAVASDKSVYFTVEVRDPTFGTILGDELWHISEDGELLWKYDINPSRLTIDVGQSSPAIGLDGTIYAAGDKLYAVTPEGSFLWSFTGFMSEAMRNSPVIGKDGTVYFVYHNIPLTALNPQNGSVLWSCQLGVNDHCFASPAIGDDGRIIVATQPGIVYAVSQTGQIIWSFNLASAGFSGTLRSSPAIDSDGNVYFGINYGNPSSAFFALNSDGTLKWKFEPADLPSDVPNTHFDIYSSPALGTEGLVYFGQEFGRIYSLNKADGSLNKMVETKSGITWSSPAIDKNGILYISDLSGTVYALKTGSKSLDSVAPWPKFRYDNQNRGQKR
jgi:outer membrane protein assembly factor BamB